MNPPADDDGDDELGPGDPDVPPRSVVFETEAEVSCPYCGERIVVGLDPGGGTTQDYVEDCQVCCRPWRVRLSYDETGAAQISIEEAQ